MRSVSAAITRAMHVPSVAHASKRKITGRHCSGVKISPTGSTSHTYNSTRWRHSSRTRKSRISSAGRMRRKSGRCPGQECAAALVAGRRPHIVREIGNTARFHLSRVKIAGVRNITDWRPRVPSTEAAVNTTSRPQMKSSRS